MTTATDATLVFADARAMYDAALQQWAVGDVRDAAEKAWCGASGVVTSSAKAFCTVTASTQAYASPLMTPGGLSWRRLTTSGTRSS